MTSEKQVQKFHTDDASLPRSGQGFWLVVPCVKFDSLNKSEVIPDRQHNTLQVWFTNNDRENAQIEIRYENEKIPGSLRNDDGDGNENDKKATGLISKTTTLHVHHAFWYISLPSLHDYHLKRPKFTFCRGREQKLFRFPFLNFDAVLENSTPKNFASIWIIKRVGISAIKFEAAQIHFLKDVFVAVAVVVA